MATARGDVPRLDIIHLSDIQIGGHFRFLDPGELRCHVRRDIEHLQAEGHLDATVPRLLAITGDIADTAAEPEYEQALELITGLAGDLGIETARIVMVPGNHDVSWDECEFHFRRCERQKVAASEPYYPKLGPWQSFFERLYTNLPAESRPGFSERRPWTLYEYPKLGLQILGLNSCWKERHGTATKHHCGWVDRDSLDALLDAAAARASHHRLALVHHNPLLDAADGTASLREGRRVLGQLADQGVHLVLCGHGHLGDCQGFEDVLEKRRCLVVPAGSASVTRDQRPEDVSNQYQILQLGPEPMLLRRRYDPHHDSGRFEADPVRDEWRAPLPTWILGGGEPPRPTVAALIDRYRERCLTMYQDLVGSLYRRDDRVGHPLIRDIYVPLKVQAPRPKDSEDTDRTEGPRNEAEAIEVTELLGRLEGRPLLLVGGAGSGKTTFLRHQVITWADEASDDALCLYVPLGELREPLEQAPASVVRLWSALAGHLERLGVALTADQLLALARDGKLRLLLDGIDELHADLRPALVRAIRDARTTEGIADLELILTTRPHALDDTTGLVGCAEHHIRFLDEDQQRLFLRRYHERLFEADPGRAEQAAEELLSQLEGHPALHELSQTPLMLLGVAVVNYRERRLPHGRDEVFRALTEGILELRYPSRAERTRQTERLCGIALAMHQRAERNVQAAVFRFIVRTQLEAESGAVTEAQVLATEEQLLGRCGLLESAGHSMRFIHLGFQEYLAARAMATRLAGDYSGQLLDDEILDHGWWREAMAMLVGQLSRDVTGYEGVKLWRALHARRLGGKAPLARAAKLAEALQEMEPMRREELCEKEETLKREIIAAIEHKDQPGTLTDRVEAAEALGRLGDPRCSMLPPRMVAIGTTGLEISAYPITVAQYAELVDTEACGEEAAVQAPLYWSRQRWTPNRPVVGVSWHQAAAFCEWLGHQDPEHTYGLPTEEEWACAARGQGQKRPYPWGKANPGSGASARANYDATGIGAPTPTGMFPTGAADWGDAGLVHDIAGNVWEWCDTRLDKDGQENDSGGWRPLRGGCFWFGAEDLEVSARSWGLAAARRDDFGFRVVRWCGSSRPRSTS